MKTKRLLLLRHGKSDWDPSLSDDHERPLAPRGVRTAEVMGRLLARSGQAPDLVVTSSAVRARTTAELAAKAGAWGCPVEVTDSLYDVTPDQALEVVKGTDNSARSVLLVGHQPTWSELGALLIGGGEMGFPTGGLARLDLAVESWRDVRFGAAQLVWLLQPKFFTKGDFEDLLEG